MFTPYFVIINEAPYAIECQESDRPADPWIVIEPKSCTGKNFVFFTFFNNQFNRLNKCLYCCFKILALWPKSEMEDKLLKLRIVGTNEISSPFLYTESHTTLLKLHNRVSYYYFTY